MSSQPHMGLAASASPGSAASSIRQHADKKTRDYRLGATHITSAVANVRNLLPQGKQPKQWLTPKDFGLDSLAALSVFVRANAANAVQEV